MPSGVSYEIQRKHGSGSFAAVQYAQAGLTNREDYIAGGNGTTYTYRVRATDSSGSSGFSSEVNAMPQLRTPVSFGGTGGNGQVSLGWQAMTEAHGYKIKRGTVSGVYDAEVTVTGMWTTSYTWTGLSPGTTYYFVIQATTAVAAGNSPFSNPISRTTTLPAPSAPGVPTISNITATTLNATAPILPANATSLTLQRKLASQSDSSYANVATGLGALAQTNVTGLQADTAYSFRYVAVNSSGNTAGSSVNATTLPNTPSAPTGLTAVGGDGQVGLSWQAATGAVSYRVERGTTTGGPYTLIEDELTALTYTDTSVTNGTTYFYVVSGVNPSGIGALSNEANSTPVEPAPGAPNAPTISNIATTQLKSTAPTLPQRADTLTLQKKLASEADTAYANVATGLAASAETTVTGLSAATEYSFRYVAVGDGGSTPGTAVNATTLPATPAAPSSLTATPSDGQVALSWSASTGATSYTVKRSTTQNGPYSTIQSNHTQTTFTDSPLTNGTTYYYVVSATSSGGESPNSIEASATPQEAAPGAPSAPAIDNIATTSLRVTAPAFPARADSLTLQKKLASEPDTAYANVATGLSAASQTNVTGLAAQTEYAFRFVAVGDGGNTPGASATVTTLPNAPSAPTQLVATAGDGVVNLSWTGSAGATSYTVKRGTVDGGPYPQTFDNITVMEFADSTVTNGTTYYYVVTASNAGGESGVSNQATASPQIAAPAAPGAPTFEDIAATTLTVQLPSLPARVSTLSLQRKLQSEADSAYVTIAQNKEGADEVAVTGLTAATTYSFRVVAVGAGGTTFGTGADVMTLPNAPGAPQNLSTTAGDGQVQLAWDAVTGATGYKVKRATVQDGPYDEINGNVAGNSFTNSGLTNGTTYYYVVSAFNTGGESPNSDPASATPQPAIPDAPLGLTADIVNGEDVELSWTASVGATGYRVYRSLQAGTGYGTPQAVTGTTFTDTTVEFGTTYYYIVKAINGGGESGASSEVEIAVPSAPTISLTATPGSETVNLSWTSSMGAVSYTAKGGTTDGGPYDTLVANTTATTYQDINLTNGTTYYYVVTAMTPGGTLIVSNQAIAIPVAPPLAPDAPTFSDVTSTSLKVHLPTMPEGAVTLSLQQKLSVAGDENYVTIETGLGAGAEVPVDELQEMTTYAFRVVAVGPGGSTPGLAATVTTTSIGDPDPEPELQADLLVRDANDQNYIGNDVYSVTAAGQVKSRSVEASETAIYHFKVENDDEESGSFILKAPAGGNGWTVQYFDALTGGTNITAQITGENGWSTGALAPVAGHDLRVEVTPDATVADDATLEALITAASVGVVKDAVKVVTTKQSPVVLGEPLPPTFSEVTATSMRVHLPALPANAVSLNLQQKLTGAGDETYTTYQDVTPGGSHVVSALAPLTSYTFRVVAVGADLQTASEPASQTTLDIERQADLLVRAQNDPDYIGDDVYSAAGVDQEAFQVVEANATAIYNVQVQNESTESNTFTLSAPAGPTGWTVQYFDALAEGTDITSQITGQNGWPTGLLAPDGTLELRVEVTPDGTITPGTSHNVLLTAKNAGSIDVKDAVQLSTKLEGIPGPQPDLWILNAGEDTEEWVGDDDYSTDGGNQSKTQMAIPGEAVIYQVRVQNDHDQAAQFHVNGPSGADGWTVKYFNTTTDTAGKVIKGIEITSSVTDAENGGWLTAQLAPDAHVEIWVEVSPDQTANDDFEVVIIATCEQQGFETQTDAVKAITQFQKIAKLEYSLDGGDSWNDVPASNSSGYSFEVQEGQIFGLRAVKFNQELPWPSNPPRPTWTRWAYGKVGEAVGETVWTAYNANAIAAGSIQSAVAASGNTLTALVKVVPTQHQISVYTEKANILSGGDGSLAQTTLHAFVTDGNGRPVENVNVQFTAQNGSGTPMGVISYAGSGATSTVTSATGEAQAVLTSGTQVGEVSIVATIPASNGTASRASSPKAVNFEVPVVNVEVDSWQLVNGAYQRECRAKVTYRGYGVLGRSVTMTSQVLNPEGNALTGYENAALLNQATGVTGSDGVFTTYQVWTPPDSGALPQDYVVEINATTP